MMFVPETMKPVTHELSKLIEKATKNIEETIPQTVIRGHIVRAEDYHHKYEIKTTLAEQEKKGQLILKPAEVEITLVDKESYRMTPQVVKNLLSIPFNKYYVSGFLEDPALYFDISGFRRLTNTFTNKRSASEDYVKNIEPTDSDKSLFYAFQPHMSREEVIDTIASGQDGTRYFNLDIRVEDRRKLADWNRDLHIQQSCVGIFTTNIIAYTVRQQSLFESLIGTQPLTANALDEAITVMNRYHANALQNPESFNKLEWYVEEAFIPHNFPLRNMHSRIL